MRRRKSFIVTSLQVTYPDEDHTSLKGLLGSRPLDIQILSLPHHGTWADLEAEFQESAVNPPLLAEFCLLLIPLRQREHILGDLQEEFSTVVVPKHGIARARLYYCWQVLVEVLRAIANAAKGCSV